MELNGGAPVTGNFNGSANPPVMLGSINSYWRYRLHPSELYQRPYAPVVVPRLSDLCESAFLHALGKLTSNTTSNYCCTGSLTAQPCSLFFTSTPSPQSSQPRTAHRLDFPLSSPTQLQPLINACEPATFGRDGEEVHDKSYRDAWVLDTERFTVAGFDPSDDILHDIHTVMVPHAPAIYSELYRVNIYGPGGHFKAHVDTPRSGSMFGSLVVCLPCEHEGGELVVKHAKSETVVNWGTKTGADADLGADDNTDVVRWAAFFADCEHEIKTVTKGYRITVTYNLYSDTSAEDELDALSPACQQATHSCLTATGPASAQTSARTTLERKRERYDVSTNKPGYRPQISPGLGVHSKLSKTVSTSAASVVEHAPLVEMLRSALACPDFMPQGGLLGFPCRHVYSQLAAYLNNSNNNSKHQYDKRLLPSLLKGSDALLHHTLLSLGLQVHLRVLLETDPERHSREADKAAPAGGESIYSNLAHATTPPPSSSRTPQLASVIRQKLRHDDTQTEQEEEEGKQGHETGRPTKRRREEDLVARLVTPDYRMAYRFQDYALSATDDPHVPHIADLSVKNAELPHDPFLDTPATTTTTTTSNDSVPNGTQSTTTPSTTAGTVLDMTTTTEDTEDLENSFVSSEEEEEEEPEESEDEFGYPSTKHINRVRWAKACKAWDVFMVPRIMYGNYPAAAEAAYQAAGLLVLIPPYGSPERIRLTQGL
eukprot:TRINITY_DN1922_c0_g1_i2.p1 TRINITY_DN1922_c0_g1~~TRINITY_DN1922_c0_g1_i2.p1  ORF type:complete len:713 (+),score=127.49 TRINITY_DN1922_c0_g1_i2:1-2139(+)